MARRWMLVAVLACCGLVAVVPAQAAVKPRTILVVPFETNGLSADEQWIGEGAAQAVALGLVQSAAFVQVDRARLRATAWAAPSPIHCSSAEERKSTRLNS